MNSSARNTLIGVGIIIIIGLLALFVWREDQTTGAPATTATSTAATSTSTAIAVTTTGTSTSGYTVTQITPASGSAAPTAPNYKTPLTFSSDISAEDQTQDEASFTTVENMLASDPTDYSSWTELGSLRQATGDYAGAAADWKYVTEIYPTDPTAFNNLGYLYWTALKEPAEAVVYYKDAIKLDPTQEATFYLSLAKVYLSENDTADAKATLEQGISAQVVGYQNLQTELNSLN